MKPVQTTAKFDLSLLLPGSTTDVRPLLNVKTALLKPNDPLSLWISSAGCNMFLEYRTKWAPSPIKLGCRYSPLLASPPKSGSQQGAAQKEWVKSSTQHGKSIQCCPIFRKEFAIRPRFQLRDAHLLSPPDCKFFEKRAIMSSLHSTGHM
ncbi:hypothetical protein EK904_008058 [Melospiza melodia maxima]|nr:hypothetical protein EK904_008058 [Melospiza melodia maxima]